MVLRNSQVVANKILLRHYYPHANNPMHEVMDWCMVRSMIRALRHGEQLPPVYMDGPLGQGNWLSGTHRVAASEIRAEIDGTDAYDDLTLIDVSEMLSDEDFANWVELWEQDKEMACDLLDTQT